MSSENTVLGAEFKELSEKIGDFIQYWGFRKIEGTIWAHIFLSPTPLCATDLVNRLQISKGLVSLAINRLSEFDVILKSEDKKEGKRVYFVANTQIAEVIETVLIKREQKMLSNLKSSFDHLNSLQDLESNQKYCDPKKIELLGQHIEKGHQLLNTIIAMTQNLKL